MKFRYYLIELTIHGDPDKHWDKPGSILFTYYSKSNNLLWMTTKKLAVYKNKSRIADFEKMWKAWDGGLSGEGSDKEVAKKSWLKGEVNHGTLNKILTSLGESGYTEWARATRHSERTIIRGRVSPDKKSVGIWGLGYGRANIQDPQLETDRHYKYSLEKTIDALYRYIL